MQIRFNPNISYKPQQRQSARQNPAFGNKDYFLKEIIVPKGNKGLDIVQRMIDSAFAGILEKTEKNISNLKSAYINGDKCYRIMLLELFEKWDIPVPKIPNQ